MSFTLTELLELSREVEDKLIAAHGEFTPELEEMTNLLDITTADKVDSYAVVMDRMGANAEWFKSQAAKYSMIQKGLEKATENIKERLKAIMIQREMTELPGNIERFKLSPSKPRLLIGDETKIPTQFLVETRTISPDKDLIREAITKGEKVDGCALETDVCSQKVCEEMKFEIDGVQITGDQITAIGKITASLQEDYGRSNTLDLRNIEREVAANVINSLTRKLLLERGAQILEAISKEQLINAVIMKFAGRMGKE